MSVAGLGARARALPDGAENCASLTACASSAGVAACDAPCLAAFDSPRLAACAASAAINAAQKRVPAPALRAHRPIRKALSIFNDPQVPESSSIPILAAARRADF